MQGAFVRATRYRRTCLSLRLTACKGFWTLLQKMVSSLLSPLRGRYAKLRLSLYADDVVIFLNPVQGEVTALFSILEQFGNASGLKLNLAKCLVAPIRCLGLDLDRILTSFAGQRVSFPIKYLGLPLTLGRLKLVHVQNIIDETRAKLAGAGWQGRLLNAAGRRELVRSVLSAILTYLLTALQVPKAQNSAHMTLTKHAAASYGWAIAKSQVASAR